MLKLTSCVCDFLKRRLLKWEHNPCMKYAALICLIARSVSLQKLSQEMWPQPLGDLNFERAGWSENKQWFWDLRPSNWEFTICICENWLYVIVLCNIVLSWIPFGDHPLILKDAYNIIIWPLRKDDTHTSRSVSKLKWSAVAVLIVIYINAGVCEKITLENNTHWNISYESTTSGAGEPFLLLDCRARACAKGVMFSQTPVLSGATPASGFVYMYINMIRVSLYVCH